MFPHLAVATAVEEFIVGELLFTVLGSKREEVVILERIPRDERRELARRYSLHSAFQKGRSQMHMGIKSMSGKGKRGSANGVMVLVTLGGPLGSNVGFGIDLILVRSALSIPRHFVYRYVPELAGEVRVRTKLEPKLAHSCTGEKSVNIEKLKDCHDQFSWQAIDTVRLIWHFHQIRVSTTSLLLQLPPPAPHGGSISKHEHSPPFRSQFRLSSTSTGLQID
jgi:hypothetical protein